MTLDSILGAVVGGLLVLALVWFWNNVLPNILQVFYHHEPSIGGKWKTTFREGDKEFNESVTLTQRGRRIKGSIVLRESDDETTTYKFQGTFRYLILSGTYESTDPTDYEQGAFALRYTRHGTFTGQHILLSRKAEQLISSDYEWIRA